MPAPALVTMGGASMYFDTTAQEFWIEVEPDHEQGSLVWLIELSEFWGMMMDEEPVLVGEASIRCYLTPLPGSPLASRASVGLLTGTQAL